MMSTSYPDQMLELPRRAHLPFTNTGDRRQSAKLGDPPANLLINQALKGVMATLQERRLGYHSRAGLEPGTSRFSTLRLNHYAARGILLMPGLGAEKPEGSESAPAYQWTEIES
jgi:hypothetical protein